jgi:rubrerythrin
VQCAHKEMGLDRARFLSLSARSSAGVAVGAISAGLLVENAAAASAKTAASSPLADLDLAVARLAVGAEILAVEFYTEAIAAKQFTDDVVKYLKRAQFNEQEHLTAMSQVLSGAGQTPSTADDFTITFPKGTFESRGSIAKFGVALETAFVGAYLGAVDSATSDDLKTAAARIATSEAQHLSVFSELAANRPVGISFPAPIDYVTASDLLDAYLS